jgi:hypothetical protein
MTNNTYTTLTGQSITIRTRKDGRMTAPTVKAILADLENREAAVALTLEEYAELYSDGPIDDEVGGRWNDLHDYAAEIASHRREVERNAAPLVWGSTAWHAFHNID